MNPLNLSKTMPEMVVSEGCLNTTLKTVSSFYETFDSVTRNNIVMRPIPAVTANMDLANAVLQCETNGFQKQIYILRLGQQYSFSLCVFCFYS